MTTTFTRARVRHHDHCVTRTWTTKPVDWADIVEVRSLVDGAKYFLFIGYSFNAASERVLLQKTRHRTKNAAERKAFHWARR